MHLHMTRLSKLQYNTVAQADAVTKKYSGRREYPLLVVAIGQIDEYERRRIRDERRVRVRQREERRERRAVRRERVLHVRVERQVREALDRPAAGGRAFGRVGQQPLTRLG